MSSMIDTLALARRFIGGLQRLEAGDAAADHSLAALFTADAHLINPMLRHADRERGGREQVAAFWRHYRTSFGEIRSEFSHLTISERAAGLFWRSRGTDAQGELVDYEGVSLLEFDGSGQIARFQAYFDSRQLVRRAEPAV